MAALALPDPYDQFEGYQDGTPRFPDDYPRHKFAPLHPAFAKRAHVLTTGPNPRRTYVDLTIGECECQRGYAYMPDTLGNKGWYANKYCGHKMRLLSSIIDNVSNPVERAQLHRPYLQALNTRYNKFEVVSAFHKELRRGDFEKAWFFGLLLSTNRGIRGVIIYLMNIVYEETRDHELAEFLLKLRRDPRNHTLDRMSQAISLFCLATKKWELPLRYDIFTNEMRGYEWLAREYGTEPAGGVAGHGNFIPAKEKDKLAGFLEEGLKKQDGALFQRGLKGLQKLKYSDKERPTEDELYEHRYWLYERLYDLADKYLAHTHDVWQLIHLVNEKIRADYGIGYHDLNAIGDAMLGEPFSSGLLSATKRAIALKRPTGAIPIGIWPAVPLYAHDNHTFRGKALMRRHADQLKPGAKQTDLDFRWCGAYFGVAYRMISYRQHGHIADWHETTWDKFLHRVTQTLWY
jgi:hypothetical protein